ncbi:MAG: hypothetical protein Q8P71_02240 [bacterium]|nr:hypothetical protein [bacterium]
MAKKGGPVKKAVEAIHKLSLTKTFRSDIKLAREKLGIPSDGFSEEDEADIFLKEKSIDLMGYAIGLLEKYQLPLTYWIELSYYMRSNKTDTGRTAQETALAIEYPESEYQTNLERFYKGFKQPYVKVFILDASAREDAFNVLSKNWNAIRESLKNQGWKEFRTRSTKNSLRDSLIVRLNEKTRKELEEMVADNPGVYHNKVELIVAIMHSEGYGEVNIDIVRKITTHNSRPKRRLKN